MLIISVFLSIKILGEDIPLGEERILPLRFPKLSLSFDYPRARQLVGFSAGERRGKINNILSATLNFETGLFENFNAGAGFTYTIPFIRHLEDGNGYIMRFFFLGKPYIALSERISLFAKFSIGLDAGLLPESQLVKDQAKRLLRQTSHLFGFGANGAAMLGAEFFPLSRLGLFIEAGIRCDYMVFRPFAVAQATSVNNTITYMIYDFPINMGLHFIL
jgi:hypothetical protein